MRYILHIIIVSAALFFASCSGKRDGKAEKHTQTKSGQKFTCPMHPQIKNDGPGTCPVCFMDLVPVSGGGDELSLKLSDSQVQLGDIRTMSLKAGAFTASKILNGRLLADPEASTIVPSRYPGRVEQLYVKQTGLSVTAGQPILKIYSEELQVLQQDYLLQMQQAAAFPKEKIFGDMLKASANKLALYGYSSREISALAKSAVTSPYITVRTGVSGVINTINVSEGQYIAEGDPLLTLENYSRLWVEADVYPQELNSVKEGMLLKVQINGSGAPVSMRLDFVSPQLEPGSQVLRIRGGIKNAGNWQPGMLATVELPGLSAGQQISVPLNAVVRDERGAHVWIKTGKNTFSPRKVDVGDESAEKIVITAGLENVSDIVISGAYLLTSEFVLKRGSSAMPK